MTMRPAFIDFMTRGGAGPALVATVHDGDTLDVHIDLGTKALLGRALWAHDVPIRLAGCNARELAQPGGPEARDHLAGLLPVGSPAQLSLVTVDKFGGRLDAVVTLPDGSDLVQLLIASNWAAAWDGTGARPVPPWPRPNAPSLSGGMT